jgi:hypothetical protein
MATRPLSRVFLVVPPDPAVDHVATLLSDTLAVHGVQVTRHVAGAAPEGAARADLALWLPDVEGRLPEAADRDVPARVHAALAVRPDVDKTRALRFDALLPIHEVLVDPVARTLASAARAPEIVAAPLPLVPAESRDDAKRARGVGGRPVVAIDLRPDFDAVCDRVLFQLALAKEPAAWVLVVPADTDARARARTLAARHQVDAWLVSGQDAVVDALPAVDLLVGRLSWAELALAAAYRVALVWRDEEGPLEPVLQVLRQTRALDTLVGVLQLAAELDNRLSDAGGLKTRGTVLADHLTADAPAFLARARGLRARAGASRTSTWEAIGPQAVKRARPVVDARDPEAPPEEDRAQVIEDELRALKDRLARTKGGA